MSCCFWVLECIHRWKILSIDSGLLSCLTFLIDSLNSCDFESQPQASFFLPILKSLLPKSIKVSNHYNCWSSERTFPWSLLRFGINELSLRKYGSLLQYYTPLPHSSPIDSDFVHQTLLVQNLPFLYTFSQHELQTVWQLLCGPESAMQNKVYD